MYGLVLYEGMENENKIFIVESEMCGVLVRAVVYSLNYFNYSHFCSLLNFVLL